MAAPPIINPPMPLLTPIPGGFMHGRIIRIQGSVSINAQRFAINLQCGPNTNPRDDLALHLNARFHERVIARNSLIMGQWGQEDRHGHLFPFIPGQGFEMIIMAESHQYKIAINGQHFCEFHCRAPMERVSYLSADGDVMITMITFEGHGHMGHMPTPLPAPMPAPMPGVPYNPGYGGHAPAAPYPAQPHYPSTMPYPAQPGMVPGMAPGYPGAAPYPAGYGHLSPKSQKKAAKKQAKAQKKAMKYGIPLAGAAVGGYALHKGLKHHKHHGHGYHGHSSSSSSSSSEEE